MQPQARRVAVHAADHPAPACSVNGATPTAAAAADADDHLDRIPDSLLLVILNKLADVRSLARCASVSRRFNALVPLVHDLHLRIDCVVSGALDCEDDLPPPTPPFMNRPSSRTPRGALLFVSNFLKLVLYTLLGRAFRGRRGIRNGGGKSYHSPAQVLKRFAHVRNLRVELPAGDVATEEGVLVKWKAEFGSTLQNCVVVGGTSTMDQKKSASPEDESGAETIPESFHEDGEMKLRVVWTIGSLIAASTRHHLLRPVIEDHPTLESLVMTDADGQGTLVMGAEQLKDFRERPAPAASNRTQIPASNMKLRYASRLDIPGGLTLQGAIMVAIKPTNLDDDGSSSSSSSEETGAAFLAGAFDEPFRAAANALMLKQSYLLEMNGF